MSAQRLTRRNDGDAIEQGLVRLAAHTVLHHIDDDSASRIRCSVFEGSVDRQRVVEHALSRFELHRDRIVESLPLFFREYSADGLHVAGKSGDGQQIPAMAARNVADTSVINGAVIESDPAGEVGHWLRACPIGVVLMPCNNAAVERRFTKQLIMPETHRTIEELSRGGCECGVPEEIM